MLFGRRNDTAGTGKTGVSCQTIVVIEKEKYFPSLGIAFRIANVFKKPLGEILLLRSPKDE